MQLVANGPDIPDSLLEAHEEGRVVFFCGAGISYPAGLPGFQGLVDKIYRQVGTALSAIEQEAYDNCQYDATLDLLERRLPGQRLTVRRALAQVLKPKLRRKGAKETHQALLQLATTREGETRLVTTNFDRIFENLVARRKPNVSNYIAPFLPIPKNSRWNGLVYLHGLLPRVSDDDALNRLVLTSGDFGLAYLTERWASRYVSELFRNYVVCFVGYSINDPVLRYMMDALAADRMQGEVVPIAYAFADCPPGQEARKTVEWEAKGVTPVLYEVPLGTHNHSALHGTLKAWGETYRDGILGKESIVVDHAIARPSTSTQEDNFVGRMLWALSDRSGLPAKRFADFDPAPPLDWLESFVEERFFYTDLDRFGVPPKPEVDAKLRFSMVCRPAPYTLAPWMMLVTYGTTGSQWDEVMHHLARWLLRHLNDPKLILWLTKTGGQLQDRLVWLIEDRLDTLARLEREGKAGELERIQAQSPNAIPSSMLLIVWRLLLSNQVKTSRNDLNLYRWTNSFEREGLTTMLRLELRELLGPRVKLKEPYHPLDDRAEAEPPKHLKQIIDWELVLATDHVDSTLERLTQYDSWRSALPVLLNDFEQLLRDALDLLRELGAADDTSDRSHWVLSSIIPHWQNRSHDDWAALIELTRDAWLAEYDQDPERATAVAQSWFSIPYPTFKRLALYAASQVDSISSDRWVGWLLASDTRWLWSRETRRETLRLLVLRGSYLTPNAREHLETAIITGPPRGLYLDNLEIERWQYKWESSVWLYLSKLELSGAPLGTDAATKLHELSAAHTEWHLAENESDEFSHWVSGTGDPGFEDHRHFESAPRKRKDLVEWLKITPDSDHLFHDDNWRETCQSRMFHCALALRDLAQEGQWPSKRWREALQAWSEKDSALRSWRLVAPLVQNMPEEAFSEVSHGLSWWLGAVSTVLNCHEDIFLALCQRVLILPFEDTDDNEHPVSKAINHPIGQVTQALLDLWFTREPKDNDELPADLEPIFTQLCDTDTPLYRHGRVLLASRLIALYRVDSQWADQNLLPLFDWTIDNSEARAVWEGFLWSPRLYQPLLISIKIPFLDTANHYNELGEHARQYAAFLTYAALNRLERRETLPRYRYTSVRLALERIRVSCSGASAKNGEKHCRGAATRPCDSH